MIRAKVEAINPLTDSIVQLWLLPEIFVDYQAGQYLQIASAAEPLSYSIANASLGSHRYELHIRHGADNPLTEALLQQIKQRGEVELSLPYGDCHVHALAIDKPIIFIAAGTGFSPIKAMIEYFLAKGTPPLMELYWGARSQSDLYMDDKVLYWQKHVPNFKYISRLSKQSEDSLASLVLSRHEKDLKEWQVVLSGPFDLVYKTRDSLLAAGVKRNSMFSDAFSFEA